MLSRLYTWFSDRGMSRLKPLRVIRVDGKMALIAFFGLVELQ